MVGAQEINNQKSALSKSGSLVLTTEILPLQQMTNCEEQPIPLFKRSHGIRRDLLILQWMG